MARILHILTKPDDSLAAEVIARQTAVNTVEIVDLREPEPDYAALLEKIFSAESVQVW